MAQGLKQVVGADGQTEFEVPLRILALWAGRSDETILKLKRADVLKPIRPGCYLLRDSLRRIDEHRQREERQTTKAAADTRVRDARTREIELRVAQRERELIPLVDANAAMDAVVGAFVSRLDSLPARCTMDLRLRRKIQGEIDELRSAVANEVERAGSEMRGDAA